MIAILLFACRGDEPEAADLNAVTIHVDAAYADVIEDFIAFAGHEGLVVTTSSALTPGLDITLRDDHGTPEGYRVDRDGDDLVVHGGGVLGVQYGLADVLEGMGFRFLHPHRPHAPVALSGADVAVGVDHAPQMGRRGLHLHTLHPIEGLYDFWEPDADGLERAKRVVDWVVKNRGNHLQWVALDDILGDTELADAWVAHTAEIIDYAHARGITTGLGVQLFGTSNLQLAFDLSETAALEPDGMRERLRLLTAPGPDLLNLSFGEFSGEEPEVFIEAGNLAIDLMEEVAPGIEVTTVIHVGNYDNLRIEYQGEEMLYYFLGTKLNATPWIHTVMYYNLFEDAGLAYLHEEFDEHRTYLLDALEAGEPVGYFPESAYWVAFDINVPTYTPLYIRSRFHDLDQIRAQVGPRKLQDHVLFSSGWEWGYWQHDVATLRMNYELPEAYDGLVHEMFAPWGDDGRRLSDAVVAAIELEHEHLLVGRLAAYLAGREIVIDVGDNIGIVSQPDRPSFAEIALMGADELSEMDARVTALRALSDGLLALNAGLEGTPDDPYFREVRDGLQITGLRARFAAEVFGGAVAHARGADPQPFLIEAGALLVDARPVIDARHSDLHWTGGDRLIQLDDTNATAYPWGYLAKGDELCFWQREIVQLENVVDGLGQSIPSCF
jgi:hypothetical protein